MTPNLVTIGREVRLPGELVFRSTNSYNGEEITYYGEYVDELKSRLQHAHEVARKYISSAGKRSKECYDTKVAFHRYDVGDVVWCLMEVRKVRAHLRRAISCEGEAVSARLCPSVR